MRVQILVARFKKNIYAYSYGPDGQRPAPFGPGMHPSTRNRPNVNSYMGQQNNGMLPEPLIWTYVVQLTSALRTIHQVLVLFFISLYYQLRYKIYAHFIQQFLNQDHTLLLGWSCLPNARSNKNNCYEQCSVTTQLLWDV